MSELKVGVTRALPEPDFKDGVAYVIGEMIDNLVSDSDRSGVEPIWNTLQVSVADYDTFPGSKTIKATMTCKVPPVTAPTIAELLERKKP